MADMGMVPLGVSGGRGGVRSRTGNIEPAGRSG